MLSELRVNLKIKEDSQLWIICSIFLKTKEY